MKKILASIAAIVAISTLSIAASAEGGLGNASFEEEATTIGAVTIPAPLDVTTEAAPAGAVDGEVATTDEVTTTATTEAYAGVNYNDGGTAASASVISASVEGNKVSSGVAETIIPVLAVAGAVAFVVSRKKK